jgi:hypothetical protein
MLVSYTCTFAIDPAEQEPGDPQEPAQVEKTNPEQEKALQENGIHSSVKTEEFTF